MLFTKTRQYNIQIFNQNIFVKLGQDKSKLQKQKCKLLILIATAAW